MPRVNYNDAMHAYAYALCYEVLRSTIREQLKAMPRPMLLKVMGVRLKRFKHFMAGGSPGKTLWESGLDFEEGMPQMPDVEIEAVALNLIADTFEDYDRPRIRRALADAILPVLRAEGREPSTL